MVYTVKLAIFPPWKAPIPYEVLAEAFSLQTAAAAAGATALASITERELAELASGLRPRSTIIEGKTVTSVSVPEGSVYGYLIYDGDGVEVSNWTTLDVALERSDQNAN